MTLLENIWENKYQILKGIYNRLFKRGKTKAEANRRLAICAKCPFNSENTDKRPFGELPYSHCIECGCSLLVKPYSLESECPRGYWEGNNLEEYNKIKK